MSLEVEIISQNISIGMHSLLVVQYRLIEKSQHHSGIDIIRYWETLASMPATIEAAAVFKK